MKTNTIIAIVFFGIGFLLARQTETMYTLSYNLRTGEHPLINQWECSPNFTIHMNTNDLQVIFLKYKEGDELVDTSKRFEKFNQGK